MRRLLVALGYLVVFGVGWCFGNQQTTRGDLGGIVWKSCTEDEKKMYAMGFMWGYALGTRDANAATYEGVYKELSHRVKLQPLTPSQKQAAEEYRKSAATIGTTSTLVLEAAVSTFYNNEQNSTVCWEKAVMLSAASLAGNAPTEEELASARKAGAERGCW